MKTFTDIAAAACSSSLHTTYVSDIGLYLDASWTCLVLCMRTISAFVQSNGISPAFNEWLKRRAKFGKSPDVSFVG